MKSGREHALSKYEDNFTDIAKEILGKGKSYAAVAAALDISLDTVERWRKEYPEFEEACKRGKAKGQAWWEDNSDANMENKDFSSVRYIFKMKSQYKVRDGTEPNSQNQGINIHAVVGMDGQEHNGFINQVYSDAKARGEVND